MLLIFIPFILAGLAFALNELAHSRSYAPTHELLKEHDLLDIVLVASVDGKLHALNRSSGHALWSMSSFATTTSVSAPSSLSPLVRSASSHDPEDDDEPETYLIEPQSGHIYVLHSPSSPLQRFPFSMPELVDLSPFTSTPMDGEQTRVFVGRKETSLLLIELETGKIKATLNSECPPIFDSDKPLQKDNDDEDYEDEDDKTQISAPTEVYIGRTGHYLFSSFVITFSFPRQTITYLSTENPSRAIPLRLLKTSPSLHTVPITKTTTSRPSTAEPRTIPTSSLYPTERSSRLR